MRRDARRLLGAAVAALLYLMITAAPAFAHADRSSTCVAAVRYAESVAPADTAALPPDQRSDFRVERTDRETHRLPLGRSGTIELRNISGSIVVTAGPGNDVIVDVTRRARGRTESDARLGLSRVRVSIVTRGERAIVETEYAESEQQPPYSVSAEYMVTAPAGSAVRASSVSGTIAVAGIAGDIAATTVSGNVTVREAGNVTDVRSVSGNVVLTGIAGTSALIARSVSGSITLNDVRVRRIAANTATGPIAAQDVICSNVELTSISGEVAFEGALAKAGRYALRSHSGHLRFVARGESGFDLQASTLNGSIQTEPTMNLRTVRLENRRSLRATVGNGSAVVLLNTFSGNLAVGFQH